MEAFPIEASHVIGVGRYEGDEILMNKRPVDGITGLDTLLQGGASPVYVSHLAPQRGTDFATDRVQPFRFRNWLFAMSSSLTPVPGFDEKPVPIPGYIQKNIRAKLPEEYIFHLFLAFLHSNGILDSREHHPELMRRAMLSAMSLIPQLFKDKAGGDLHSYAAVCSNGVMLFAANCNRAMSYRTLLGLEGCTACDEAQREPHAHAHYKAVAVTDMATGDGWHTLPFNSMILVDSSYEVLVTPFELETP